MAHVRLEVQARPELGSAAARRLRREGLVPGVLYQKGEASIPFVVTDRELRRALHGDGGRTAVLDIAVAGAAGKPALFKEWQLHPVRDAILHVDLQQVDLTEAVQVAVQLVLVGTPVGVRDGGVLDQPVRELSVRALPESLPERIEYDVSELTVGGTIHASDLVPPDGCEILDDLELVLASVMAPTVEVEAEEAPEEGEPEIVGGAEPGAE